MKFFILIFIFTSKFAFADSGLIPDWINDLSYNSIGSCETNNLNFNAARFTKINLNQKRDNLDLYLQIIIFIEDNGKVNFRTQEMGLLGCQLDANKQEVCSYRPYPSSKKIFTSSWESNDQQFKILNLGSITKFRNDFPWMGYNLKISEDFPYSLAHDQNIVGGKVQINFNNLDQNVVFLCPHFLGNL